MDPAALSWIEHWYPVAWKGLLAGASLTVIAGITAYLVIATGCPIRKHQIHARGVESLGSETTLQPAVSVGRRLANNQTKTGAEIASF
jgi:hypothetical protein